MEENEARRVYGDIIDLPHHRSRGRPHMSLHDRAAQFAPFAALSGYDAMVKEEARLTQARPVPSEEEQERLNRSLQLLMEETAQKRHPRVRILYFVPDLRKAGGSFRTVVGRLKRVDAEERRVVLYGENGVSSGFTVAFAVIERAEILPAEEAAAAHGSPKEG